jgi:hypothetical protein
MTGEEFIWIGVKPNVNVAAIVANAVYRHENAGGERRRGGSAASFGTVTRRGLPDEKTIIMGSE